MPQICGTTHKTVRRVVERHNVGGAVPPRKDRGHNSFNTQRIHGAIGDIPPAEHEAAWYAAAAGNGKNQKTDEEAA